MGGGEREQKNNSALHTFSLYFYQETAHVYIINKITTKDKKKDKKKEEIVLHKTWLVVEESMYNNKYRQ